MSRPDPWAHIEHPMCSLCVLYTHIHQRTLSPASKMEKTQDNTSIRVPPSLKNHHPRQAIISMHRPVEPSHPRPPMQMNKLRIHERMCTPCSDCVADIHGDFRHTCGMYTPTCTGAQDTCSMHTRLTAKMHIHPHKHARAMVLQLLRHVIHCNPSCNLSSVQETARIHARPWRNCSCVATQASSQSSSALVRARGLIQFVYGSQLPFGRLRKHPRNSISTTFAGFSIMHLQSSSSKPLKIYTILLGGFSSIHVSYCGSQFFFV